MRLLCLAPVLLSLVVGGVTGHGNMVYPYVWMDTNEEGHWQSKPGGGLGCGSISAPNGSHTESPKIGCIANWFTNNTKIPHKSNGQANNPWHAPGTAPIFSPCGVAGGNPEGCTGQEHEKFGDCCGDNCGGYSLGENAEEYPWPDAPVTEWKAGSYQEVSWFTSANHEGGYIYRLCKKPKHGLTGLTEECFQEGSLKFEGDQVWFEKAHDSTHERQELNATRVTKGTFPEGSEWTEIPVANPESGYIIDYVKVPADLDHGDHVLSFRWDCKKTTQVWNICANIKIV